MTGIKDPTEPPKVEQLNQEGERINAVVKRSLADLTNIYMEDLFQLSRDMTESFRLMLDNLRLRFEQFREENQSIFDLFSIAQLQKWTQREQ